MCAKWMTDDEVAEMLDANELSERFEEPRDNQTKHRSGPTLTQKIVWQIRG